jgi:NAD(P)H-hydrate epimerase
MKIFTAQQMRDFDKEAVETYHIPSMVLMENAALRVVEFLEAKFSPLREKKIVVLCGKGNNGGDGFAIARHLDGVGCGPMVVMAAAEDQLKGDALANFQALRACLDAAEPPFTYLSRGRIVHAQHLGRALELFFDADIVVDALLGTGFQVGMHNAAQLPLMGLSVGLSRQSLVAIDIPSAVSADTGEAASQAGRADYTITFAAPKRGMFVRDGLERCGEIWVGDIGAAARQMDEAAHRLRAFHARIRAPHDAAPNARRPQR